MVPSRQPAPGFPRLGTIRHLLATEGERPAKYEGIPVLNSDANDRPPPVHERPTWLTYAQAAERLGLSAEAIRHRARRSGWRTQPGNDGRTLVLIPDGEVIDIRHRTPVHTAVQSPARTPRLSG
jgi:hypothetical protein